MLRRSPSTTLFPYTTLFRSIGVSLHQNNFFLFSDLISGKINPVNHFTLVIDGCLRRVDIFCSSLLLVQNPAGKCNQLSRWIENRKHQPFPESIIIPAAPAALFDKVGLK